MAKDKFGLRPLTDDKRDFDLGKVFSLPKLSEIPNKFTIGDPIIKHQGDTDKCSAYASCGMSELQEGVELNPDYSFALSKKISGNIDAWGQNLRDAISAHIKYGAIEKGETNIDSRALADYPPELAQKALLHRKQSYFKISGPHTSFDNIRASLWAFKDKKQAVLLGVLWSWPLYLKNLLGIKENGFGHAIYAIGADGDYLIIVNSYGKEAGDQGIHYLHKDTVNHFTKRFGEYMIIDIPVKEAKLLNDRAECYYTDFYLKPFLYIKRLWRKQ